MAAPRKQLYRLVVRDGPDSDRRILVPGNRVRLGRLPGGRIAVDEPGTESEQVELVREETGVFLCVLGSAGGRVTVNGETVERAALSNDDLVGLGETTLRFQLVEPLPDFVERRRPSLQILAAVVLTLVAVIQTVVLAALALGRPNALTMFPRAEPADPTAMEATLSPEERARLSIRLEDARLRLRELQTDQASQSVEELWDGTQSAILAEQIGALRSKVADLGHRIGPPLPSERTRAGDGTDQALEGADRMGEAPPGKDPGREARRMLTEARLDIAAGNLDQADQVLERLQALDPDMVSGYVTRARLMERQDRLTEAVAQWDEALKRTAGTPFYEEATAERIRLNRVIRLRESEANSLIEKERILPPAESPPPPERPPPALPRREVVDRVAPAPVTIPNSPRREPAVMPSAFKSLPRIRIVDVQRERFQNRESYEEIRLVRIVLQPRKREGELDPTRMRVEVQFYDRDLDTSAVEMSRVPTPKSGLSVFGDWSDMRDRTLTALYMVHEGFRDLERTTYGQRRQYYGYVVRVYYQGELQDEHAFPTSLLSRN
jgi:tetratricopeptide (TPR) repeat protein